MTRRLVFACALALGALVAFAAPASAHAELKDTTPVSGARLETAPRQVLLRFTERVEVALGGVRIFDGAGTASTAGGSRIPKATVRRWRSRCRDSASGPTS